MWSLKCEVGSVECESVKCAVETVESGDCGDCEVCSVRCAV